MSGPTERMPSAADIAAGTHAHSPPFTLLHGQQANFVTALTTFVNTPMYAS